jgi:hypothetical protein
VTWPDRAEKGYRAEALQGIEGAFLHPGEEPLPLSMTQSDRQIFQIRRIADHDGVVGCRDLGTLAALTCPASMPDQPASPIGHVIPTGVD